MIYEASRDAIDGTPLLRNALLRNALHARRCLVLADGFFADGKQRQPTFAESAVEGSR